MSKFLKRAAHGAQVPHEKRTSDCETVTMPVPSKIVLSMAQHIGAPAAPAVAKGDQVYVGTVVGKAGGFVSSDIHSGVSGTVDSITTITAPNGAVQTAVVIIPDGEQKVDPAIAPPVVTDLKSFQDAVRASGLVGLGGAGFPTAVKLAPKNMDEIDRLVINAAECEPYITSDNRCMLEDTQHILSGIEAVMKYLEIPQCVIGIEQNKPKAIAHMKEAVAGKPIEIKELPCSYPQGAEKVLIENCTGREVPFPGLPSDVGVIVMNVTSVAFVGKYLATGMPLVTKRLTVDGDIVKEPKNVEVIIGTPVWAGRCSSVVRSFLKQHGKELNRVAYVLTRGSEHKCEDIYRQMDQYTGKPHQAATSLRVGHVGHTFWQEEFLRQIRELLAEEE